jgi:predicted DNA-binding transcriptional regulator YafY
MRQAPSTRDTIAHQYEDLSGREDSFRQLKQAIEHRYPVNFRYRKPDGEKLVEAIEPYQLVNQNGIWYLAACEGLQALENRLPKCNQTRTQLEADTP